MLGSVKALNNLTKNSIKSSVILVIFKLFSAILQFPAIILLTKAWSSEQMGVWLLLISLSQIMLITADIGLGQSLRLAFAKSDQLTKTNEGERVLNSGVSILIILSIIFLSVFVFIFSMYKPDSLFSVSNAALKTNINIGFIFFIGLTLTNIPITLITQLYFAFYEPEKTVYYDLLRTIILFIASILANSNNFLIVIIIYALFTTITRLIQFIKFYSSKNWTFKFIHIKTSWSIINPFFYKGVEFWILSIVSSLQISCFSWMIARVMPVTELGNLTLLIQITGFLLVLHVSYFLPLQSRYSIASYREAKSYLMYSLAMTIIIIPIMNIFIFEFLPLINKITSKNIEYNFNIILCFAIWSILWTLINTFSIMLNGFGKIKSQILGLLIAFLISNLSIVFNWSKDIFDLFYFIILGLLILLFINLYSIFNLLKSIKSKEIILKI